MRRAILNGLLILTAAGCMAGAGVHHDLAVRLTPAAGTLAVSDTVVFPATGADSVRFLLHDGLEPASRRWATRCGAWSGGRARRISPPCRRRGARPPTFPWRSTRSSALSRPAPSGASP